MGKNNSWLYISSIFLVVGAIAVTAIIDRSKPAQQGDVRARAGVKTGQAATAVISKINESQGTIEVTDLIIGSGNTSKKPEQLWTITLPTDVSVGSNISNTKTGSFSEGAFVRLKLVPSTINISAHTATALDVTVGR